MCNFWKSIAFLLFGVFTFTESKCPKECRCSLDDRGRKTVTCQKGGMRDAIPIPDMEEETQILIISAPHRFPNHLSLGPIFKQLKKLEEIHIKWSAVPNIGAHSFWGLKNLKVLNLTHNSLSTLMDSNFKGVGSLKHLDLSYNEIQSVPSAAFRYVKHLHSLNLSHNKIKQLVTRIFFGLTRLEHLDLSDNPLGSIVPELFSDTPVLKKLSCAACQLEEIHENVLKMISEVKDLDFRNNNLLTIPEGISALESLMSVKLDGNKIQRIAEYAFTESPVTHVYLSHNELTEIEFQAFSNSTVTHLDLSYNRLSSLNSGGFPFVLEGLRELQLSGNPLQTDEFFSLLNNALQLHHLGLGDVGLSELPSIIGRGRGLHSLNISSNFISVLPYELFSTSPHLRLLDISFNKFEGIGEDVLEALSLAKDLRILKLRGNPWQCDQCHVAPLLKWLQRSPDQESGCDEPKVWTCLKCIGPDTVKHQPLALLPPGDLPKCKIPPTKASLSQSDPSSKSLNIDTEPLTDEAHRQYVDILDELKIAPPLDDRPVYSRDGLSTNQGDTRDGTIITNNTLTVFFGVLSFLIIIICVLVLAVVIRRKHLNSSNILNVNNFRIASVVSRRNNKSNDSASRRGSSEKDEIRTQHMTELDVKVDVLGKIEDSNCDEIRESEIT